MWLRQLAMEEATMFTNDVYEIRIDEPAPITIIDFETLATDIPFPVGGG
jgi:hypothetical protein